MDDYLDEALVGDDSENAPGPTPPKQGKRTNLTAPSNSFHYKNCTPTQNNPSSNKSVEDTPTHVIDEGTVLPLTHSVSFYRKQQAQVIFFNNVLYLFFTFVCIASVHAVA